METDAIARPHLTTTPFAATLWETTKRHFPVFSGQYAFTKDRSTNRLYLLYLAAGWKRRRTIPFSNRSSHDIAAHRSGDEILRRLGTRRHSRHPGTVATVA
jgi:hypothetical protein